MKRSLALVVAVCTALGSTTALADGSSDDDAERLFREAQKLMSARHFGEACPKLEAVYEKDHELGTLLNLAYCHKMQGASWQAWLEFKEAEVKAISLNRTDRRDFARKRMAELEKPLVRAVVDVSPSTDLTDVLVEDRRVPDAEKGVVFAAESGPRKVTFRAKGKKPLTQLVTFAKGDRPQHVPVPPLEDEPREPPKPLVVAEPAPAQIAPEPASSAPPADPPRATGGTRTLAYVFAGVGAVGIGAGAVTGVMTFTNACSSHGWGSQHCPPAGSAARKSDIDRGQMTGMISTVSFAVGIPAAVAAVVLLWMSPSSESKVGAATPGVTVVPEVGAGWAALHGEF